MLRVLLALDAALLAAGYGLGPSSWRSSSTFAVVHALGIPFWLWAGAFAACAVALWLRMPLLGYGIGAVTYTFWGLAIGATVITGDLAAWGAPVHLLAVFAPLHLYGLRQAVLDRMRGARE